ncbi:MAG TPA: hypothetical protein PLE43_09375 [Alphaproteobacteria bacterium]|nr:hypothetical protein [Alphaproteobacteria bacterium]
MAKKKSFHSHYKHEGGFVGLPRRVFKSEQYKNLGMTARCLLDELQHKHTGSNNGRIIFSVEMAMKNLGISYNTAKNAFKELEHRGFIERSLDANYMNGQAREWRLTYEPCYGREPTDDWVLSGIDKNSFSPSNFEKTPSKNEEVTDALKEKRAECDWAITKNQYVSGNALP